MGLIGSTPHNNKSYNVSHTYGEELPKNWFLRLHQNVRIRDLSQATEGTRKKGGRKSSSTLLLMVGG